MDAETIDRGTESAGVADEVVDRAEIRDGTVVVAYSRTEAALAQLRQQYAGVVFDCSTPAEDKRARAARLDLVTLRSTLERTRKGFKAPALEFGRRIDDEAKRLEERILGLERPIDEQIKAEEARREDERVRRIEAERQRVAAIRERIEQIAGVARRAIGKPSADVEAKLRLVVAIAVDDSFAELRGEAERVHAETLAALRELLESAQAIEAEAARQQAERDRLARVAAEQAAEAERLAAQRDEQERAAADLRRRERIAELDRVGAALLRAVERVGNARADAELARYAVDARGVLSSDVEDCIAALDALQPEPPAQERTDDAAETSQSAVDEPSPASTAEAASIDGAEAFVRRDVVAGLRAADEAHFGPTDDGVRIKLGDICRVLGFTVDREFVEVLCDVKPASVKGRAVLFRACDWARLVDAIAARMVTLRNQRWTA